MSNGLAEKSSGAVLMDGSDMVDTAEEGETGTDGEVDEEDAAFESHCDIDCCFGCLSMVEDFRGF